MVRNVLETLRYHCHRGHGGHGGHDEHEGEEDHDEHEGEEERMMSTKVKKVLTTHENEGFSQLQIQS